MNSGSYTIHKVNKGVHGQNLGMEIHVLKIFHKKVTIPKSTTRSLLSMQRTILQVMHRTNYNPKARVVLRTISHRRFKESEHV